MWLYFVCLPILSCYANFSVFMDCKSNQFSLEMNNDHELNSHSTTKLSGWLCYCCLGHNIFNKASLENKYTHHIAITVDGYPIYLPRLSLVLHMFPSARHIRQHFQPIVYLNSNYIIKGKYLCIYRCIELSFVCF